MPACGTASQNPVQVIVFLEFFVIMSVSNQPFMRRRRLKKRSGRADLHSVLRSIYENL
jgi:hypothetical protein